MQQLERLSIVFMAITLLSTPGQFLGGRNANAASDIAQYGLIFNLAFHTEEIDNKCHVLSIKERKKVDETLNDLASSDKLGVLKQPLLSGRSLYKPSCADMEWVRDWRKYAKTGYLREK